MAPCPGYSSVVGDISRRLFIVAGVIALGYLSSWISLHAVELKIARRVGQAQASHAMFFVRPDEDDETRRALWKEVAATVVVDDPSKHKPSQIPWGSCGKAVPWLPFLASIESYLQRTPLVGNGGTLWYFCLFGLTFELGYSSQRMS